MIILASKSPRRKELLTQMGIKYEIIESTKPEFTAETEPSRIVEDLSLLKAEDVLYNLDLTNAKYKNSLIIAADTMVFYKDERLGKPKDEADAVRMIKMLSGNEHEVITGVTLIEIKLGLVTLKKSFSEITKVKFYELSDEEIEAYVKTGEPMDKAGAYAIQGLFAKHVKGIDGDYSNVVGLPISRLYNELKCIGFEENAYV